MSVDRNYAGEHCISSSHLRPTATQPTTRHQSPHHHFSLISIFNSSPPPSSPSPTALNRRGLGEAGRPNDKNSGQTIRDPSGGETAKLGRVGGATRVRRCSSASMAMAAVVQWGREGEEGSHHRRGRVSPQIHDHGGQRDPSTPRRGRRWGQERGRAWQEGQGWSWARGNDARKLNSTRPARVDRVWTSVP